MRHINRSTLLYPQLWKNCIGAWCPSLGATGSTLYNWSSSRDHGTLTNMDPATDWVISGGKYSLDFDGSNDHVLIGGTTDSRYNGTWLGRSVFLWMRQTKAAFATLILMRKGGGAPLGITYQLALSATVMRQQLLLNSVTSSGANRSWSDTDWHSIGFTIGVTGSLTFYWDGVEDGTATVSYGGDNTSEAFRISHSTSTFLGNIDDIRIYNTVLTANTIRQLANRRGIAYETRRKRHFNISSTVFTGSAGLVLGNIESSISATHTTPTYTGSASLTLGNIESVSTATFTSPTYTASSALTLGNIESVITSTFTSPTYTGSAELTLGKLQFEAFLTFATATFTATSALTLGNIESVISATFTSPVYTATSSLTLGNIESVSSAAFAVSTFTASASLTLGNIESVSSATFTVPIYTASSTLTLGNIESVSTALFAAVVRSATAELTLGNVESVSTATFTMPTYTATTTLTLGNIESVSTATFTPPVFTAAAALMLGNVESSISATFVAITYSSTVIVLLGGIELVGESVFLAAPPIAWHYYKYLLSGNVYEYYV